MKKILTLLAFCLYLISNAQVSPSSQFINYQAVIRDANGVPIAAGNTVNLNVRIFNDGTVTTHVYEENHNVTIPVGNVVSIRIGKGNAVPPANNFSAIQWNTGEASYVVSLNGTPLGPKTFFGSVPYALNVGAGSAINYSPSANVSTTGNILDLTDKLTGSVSVGSNQAPFNSKVPMLSFDQKGRVITAGEYPVNMGGDIGGRLDSQYVKKLAGTPLSSATPVAGQVMQFNGTNWTPSTLSGGGPWSYNANTIYPSNNIINDKVGIGTSTATSLLDVRNSGLSPYISAPVASFSNQNPGFNTSGVVHIANQTGSSPGLFVQNMNASAGSEGVIVQMASNASGSDGVRATHVGPGRAGNFIGTSQTSTVEVLGASGNANMPVIRGTNSSVANGSLAIGVHGKTSNANSNAAGVWGENVGGGSGVIGTTSANVGAVVGVNLTGANVAGASGVFGLSNSTHTNSAGTFGESKGAGYGVYGINTSTLSPGFTGVYGTTTGTFNTNTGVLGEMGGAGVGVRGINKGTGNSIQGTKPSGSLLGSAGRFEVNDNNNPSAALFAITQGAGAAVQAQAGIPLTSALSLNMVNGHMKSSGGNIVVPVAMITHSVVGNYSISLSPLCSNCNDVRGEVTFYVNTTAAIGAGHYAEVIIPFTKPYGAIPVVVVSPLNDQLGMHHMVSLVTMNDFRIRIYRPAGQAFPSSILAGSSFSFSYYVME